jgi:hypothetical protein
MSEGQPYRFHAGLEVGRFVVFMVVGVVLFLFFTLLLDLVGLVVGGGWNPLLGDWPIFSGTVSAMLYSAKGSVIILLLSFGVLMRLLIGPVTPSILSFLDPNRSLLSPVEEEKEA